ncbi:hypothetical protein Glove_203g97 [Diversispora epigaea]|uniref:Uncharacterized protein n=1 Tax=Diversispora epigaea TaxID=1348612 RepID=A0A397IJ93_9GLOM|nr:hypothetical protein Glove_203g97 [Diversispora epigaea]
MYYLDLSLYSYQIKFTKKLLLEAEGRSLVDKMNKKSYINSKASGTNNIFKRIKLISLLTTDNYKNLMKVMVFVVDDLLDKDLSELHSWVHHIVDTIHKFRAINEYTTETYEALHKTYVKIPYYLIATTSTTTTMPIVLIESEDYKAAGTSSRKKQKTVARAIKNYYSDNDFLFTYKNANYFLNKFEEMNSRQIEMNNRQIKIEREIFDIRKLLASSGIESDYITENEFINIEITNIGALITQNILKVLLRGSIANRVRSALFAVFGKHELLYIDTKSASQEIKK